MTRIYCDECGKDMTDEESSITLPFPIMGPMILRKPFKGFDTPHICWGCILTQLGIYFKGRLGI